MARRSGEDHLPLTNLLFSCQKLDFATYRLHCRKVLGQRVIYTLDVGLGTTLSLLSMRNVASQDEGDDTVNAKEDLDFFAGTRYARSWLIPSTMTRMPERTTTRH